MRARMGCGSRRLRALALSAVLAGGICAGAGLVATATASASVDPPGVPVVSEVQSVTGEEPGILGQPEGPATGFTEVKITGEHLLDQEEQLCVACTNVVVHFGAKAVPVYAGTQEALSVVAPPGTAGTTVDITVTTAAGTSATGVSDQFKYTEPLPVPAELQPTVTSVTAIGFDTRSGYGGAEVRITGTNFEPCGVFSENELRPRACDEELVYFGGEPVELLDASSTELLVFVPAPNEQTVNVTVITKQGGASAISAASVFRFGGDAPPSASISSPASGGVYTQGQVVATQFSCQAGVGTSVLKSCDDNTGTVTTSGGAGELETSQPGTYTYVVTAVDRDGQAATAHITYSVTAASGNTAANHVVHVGQHRVVIETKSAPVLGRRAKIMLACVGGKPGTRCRGTVLLTAKVKRRVKRLVAGSVRTVIVVRKRVIARAKFSLPTGAKKVVSLRLTRAGLRRLHKAHDRAVKVHVKVKLRGRRRAIRGRVRLKRASASG